MVRTSTLRCSGRSSRHLVEELEARRLLAATVVRFDGFASTTGLTLNGSTETVSTADGKVLRLVGAVASDAGSAFSNVKVNAADFSTFFVFRITNPGGASDSYDEIGADGLVFVIQSISSSLGGSGEGLGYGGIEKSVGVEFDTFGNAGGGWNELNDPSSNHVGIDTVGNIDHGTGAPYAVNIEPDFDNGQLKYAWVDYTGTRLEVRVNTTSTRPASPTLSRDLDIPAFLEGDTAYIGFTAGTGLAWGNHDIVRWEYRTEYAPISVVPEAQVLYTNTEIVDGDTTPSTGDGTNFGSVAVGSASPVRTFTVRNTGQAALTTSALSVPAGFTITEGLAGSIAPGGSDTVTVKLNTTVGGSFQGNISFVNNDSNENPYNFTIKGVVTAATSPEIEVRGNNVVIADGDTTASTTDHTDFGSVAAGGVLTRTFTVKNTGTAALNTSGMTITKLDGGATSIFTVTEPLSATIAAGASDTFTVRFSYTTAGTYERLLKFSNNDSNENPYNFVIKAVVNPVATGSIAGTLFHDFNGNGTKDSGESVLSGWTVYIDADKDGIFDTGEKSVLSKTDGTYAITGLASGSHRVRRVLNSGWIATTAAYYDLTVSGAGITGKNFGLARPATISGKVFNDINADGFQDAGDNGRSAWKVFIDADNDGVLDTGELTATTDASGNYSFTGLKPGTFSVRLIVNTGYTATTPTSYSCSLTSGSSTSGRNFGAKA